MLFLGNNFMENKKDKNLLCVSACLQYMFAEQGYGNIDIPNMDWIIDMALYCYLSSSLSIELRYHKSRLMDDYFLGQLDNDEVKERVEFLLQEIMIWEEEITESKLKNLIAENMWGILNVNSNLLFNDVSFAEHRHFVLIKKQNTSLINVISPGSENFRKINVTISDLADMIKGNGQWAMFLN